MAHSPRTPRTELLIIGLMILGLTMPMFAAPESKLSPAERQAAQEALADFNDLIGGWRGVGQPRRGSNRGAWRQNAEFIWDFQPDSVGILYQVDDGKLVAMARVTWDASQKEYVLTLSTPEESERVYRGRKDGKKIVLDSQPDADGDTHRITITKLSEKRTLVLHEKKSTTQATFFRVAEVGYTREGTRLATPGGGQPECIVTGGAGTTKVVHNGKTYYVCCSGCKQAFEDDPEGIIAEAAERRKKEAEKRR